MNARKQSLWSRISDTTADALLALSRSRLFSRSSVKQSGPAESEQSSALLTTTLDEHVGLAGAALPALPKSQRKPFWAGAAIVLLVIIVGFFAQMIVLSSLQNSRDQQVAYDAYRVSLASGTAPVSPVGYENRMWPEGTPVAIIQIAKLNIRSVILEGTSSSVTMSGPGHRRDTPLPGQVGVSTIFGRQLTYGGVFSAISTLTAGDEIKVTTGQGVATYTVMDVRYTGDKLPAAPAVGEGRLTLVTGAGIPLISDSVVRVDAKLTSKAFPTPSWALTSAGLDDREVAMQGDSSAWPVLGLTVILIGLFLIVFVLLRRFWGKWQAWIVGVPVLAAMGIFAATQIATLFPNLI